MFFKLLRVARPQFLIASITLYTLGACWAILNGAPFVLPQLTLGYLIILPAHLSVSYSNDLFDVEADRFGSPTLFSGGSGLLVTHAELRRPALTIALALIGLSLSLAVAYQEIYHPPSWFFVFVMFSDVLGWFYSAPPLRLAYRGLGELTTLTTAGLLLPGMGFIVAGGRFDAQAAVLAAPLMLYGLAFILTVEIPDLEADRLGGKRTVVTRIGRRAAFTWIGLIYMINSLFFFTAWNWAPASGGLSFPLLGLASLLPTAASLVGLLRRPAERGPATAQANFNLICLAIFLFLADWILIRSVLVLLPHS